MAKKRVAKRMKKTGRDLPIQNVVNTGPLGSLAGSGGVSYYVNSAHLLSMLNRRAFHQVTSSGHLKNYGIEVQVFNMVNASTSIETAPLSYATYNATRAWHFARKERFEEAGFKLSDLGYGERLRIALDKDMADLAVDGNWIKPSHLVATIDDKGEWDWSDVIITPPMESWEGSTTAVVAGSLQDSFVLHLCGTHTEDSSDSPALKYSHVGMIQSWTENRRGWAAPDSDEVVQPENPLAFARLSESSSMRITENVADEQKQAPPYSNADDDDAESVFAKKIIQGQLETKFPNPTTNNDMIIAPGGVAKITITNNDSSAGYPQVSLRIVELD